MKYLALLLLPLSVMAADLPKELYMPNDDNGFVVVTIEECKIDEAKKEYPYRAYATESDGTIHEGCWVDPDLHSKHRDIPIFNLTFGPGLVVTYKQYLFSEEKKRWEVTPTIEVKPTL